MMQIEDQVHATRPPASAPPIMRPALRLCLDCFHTCIFTPVFDPFDPFGSWILLRISLLLLSTVVLLSADRAYCMPGDSTRVDAFKSTVVFELGAGAGNAPRWRPQCTIPTLHSLQPFRDYARRRGLNIESWLYSDMPSRGLRGPLASRGAIPRLRRTELSGSLGRRLRRRLQPPRAPPGAGPEDPHQIRDPPLERPHLGHLEERSGQEDLLRAYIWDCLTAFEASLPVLSHCIAAIKAWHQRLAMRPPADGPGDYRRLTRSLARFQGVPRRLIFPIHADAVRLLLLLPVPPHPACSGARPASDGTSARCPTCWAFLLCWVDCLAGALTTVLCCRCEEGAMLQVCDVWLNYDWLAGYQQFVDGTAYNVKVRKNDQFRQGHQPRCGRPKDPRLDVTAQLLEMMRQLGCTKRAEPGSPCPRCPPLFPRRINGGRNFDLSRQPSSEELSAMIVRGLGHVGVDTALFSGISARRGGLSTVIEAGVPECILWMQSGHA
jgi:hypothetical protein